MVEVYVEKELIGTIERIDFEQWMGGKDQDIPTQGIVVYHTDLYEFKLSTGKGGKRAKSIPLFTSAGRWLDALTKLGYDSDKSGFNTNVLIGKRFIYEKTKFGSGDVEWQIPLPITDISDEIVQPVQTGNISQIQGLQQTQTTQGTGSPSLQGTPDFIPPTVSPPREAPIVLEPPPTVTPEEIADLQQRAKDINPDRKKDRPEADPGLQQFKNEIAEGNQLRAETQKNAEDAKANLEGEKGDMAALQVLINIIKDGPQSHSQIINAAINNGNGLLVSKITQNIELWVSQKIIIQTADDRYKLPG